MIEFDTWWKETGVYLAVDHVNEKYLRNVMQAAYSSGYAQAVSDDLQAIRESELMMLKRQAD